VHEIPRITSELVLEQTGSSQVENNMKLTILISGGLDSTVLLHHALRSTPAKDIVAVSIMYARPHTSEIQFARETCDDLGVDHVIVDSYPWNRTSNPIKINDIPWLPIAGDPMVIRGRNSLFVILAYIVAECDEIWLGCNADDQQDYEDCREGWAEAIGRACQVRVCLPFCCWTKRQIVQMSRLYNIDLETTLSCYRGQIPGCGECNACILRAEAMKP
jgi:7-cyano-7-deazaguanine synthase